MAPDEAAAAIALLVELVWSPAPGDVRQRWLHLPAGYTVAQGLQACDEFADQLPRLAALKVGIWGRLCELDTPLRERDRIEVYRPLTVDPKEARRLRYRARGRRIVSRHRPLNGRTDNNLD